MVKGQLKSLRITLEATESGVLGYVYLRDISRGEVAKTVQIGPRSISADYDGDGNLVGVELLNAERADATIMRELAAKLSAPELGGLDLAEMCKAPAE